jgi:tetratricopeptide (TPR) repeat protein
VEIRFGDEPPIPVEFDFEMTDQDYAYIRWYLESFLQYPMDPAPQMARRIEERMREIGVELFEKMFCGRDAMKLWGRLQIVGLGNVRVEIVSGARDAAAIPWELLRDPDTDTPLALEALAFVRASVNPSRLPRLLNAAPDKVRILLVICRPGGVDDVPFRSVAGKLLKGFNKEARERFELTLLRPPTLAALADVLRRAKAAGQPFHIVHFDGHGAYLPVKDAKIATGALRRQTALVMTATEGGAHGYLLFENPKNEDNLELVGGTSLGTLLHETGVPVLVLNACRSAHADIQREPQARVETHEAVRAYGSLAQEVMDAGVAGVVAMRYNVYVVTAAQFVAELYGALAEGAALGEAVSRGRKNLAEAPLRAIAFDPIPLQDWSVPVVYEATPLYLFPKRAVEGRSVLLPFGAVSERRTVRASPSSSFRLPPSSFDFHPSPFILPPSPDAGFFGRDETILTIDRAFDHDSIVLLHACAGQGKTATAAEFARWYAATGGLSSPIGRGQGEGQDGGIVLFTSFEQHTPLARALDAIGQAFGRALERSGVQWGALEDLQRAKIALQVLTQIPVLWVWDNVEPVAGFPAGSDSPWSRAEQDELVFFLHHAKETKAKFLLTSRRDELGWLGNLPVRVALPPMPMQERVQLACALARKYNRRITAMEDWEPLLAFTQGNPLTLTVLVSQALRNKLKLRWQVEAFVEGLRAGRAKFDDEAGQGRSRSLGASLDYGFKHMFSEDERRVLALLHFFQGFVNTDVLQEMGSLKKTTGEDLSLLEIQGLTRETIVTLLDRAAETGLLTAHGNGTYSIHPALPWYFKGLFEQYYVDDGGPKTEDSGQPEDGFSPTGTSSSTVNGRSVAAHCRRSATRAFVEAMGKLGNYYHGQYEQGNRDVITALRAEQANLLFARAMARKYGWRDALIGTMQGLLVFYDHTGRRGEWKRLVEEVEPDFVDAATGAPLLGHEELWSLVVQYRVRLARETRQWLESEQLQHTTMEWDRHQAEPFLALPSQELTENQRNAIRSLAAGLHELGEIQREMGSAECINAYQEALGLLEKIGEATGAAVCAFSLSRAYLGDEVPALRDLDAAQLWCERSLELRAINDGLGRGKCLITLGTINYKRFKDARDDSQPQDALRKYMNAVLNDTQQALTLLPPDAVDDLAAAYNQTGNIYRAARDPQFALTHYNKSIQYRENAGDIYGAAQTRYNVALALADSGQLDDALLYAQTALRNFQQYGEAARAEQEKTEGLIGEIKDDPLSGASIGRMKDESRRMKGRRDYNLHEWEN